MKSRVVMALVGLVTAGASLLVAQDAPSVLRRSEDAYSRVRTLTASFRQTIINPMLGGPEESRGTLYIERPGRFSMRFSDPEGDRIVVDGTWLWAYAPSSVPGQVIKQSIPEAGALTPNLIAQFTERPLERYSAAYEGSGYVEGEPVQVVALTPRTEALGFRTARVSISDRDGLPHRIELVELSGQRRVIVLESIWINTPIPDTELRFEVPRGVRVVTP